MLNQVNLVDRRNSKINELSHGMRKRVAIAQAFLGDPELILMDEPLNGLDPREVFNIRNLIKKRKGSQTILISSHILTEVEATCDHVAFIEKGRTVHVDSLENITGKGQVINYHVEPGGTIPVDEITKAVPGAEVQCPEGQNIITVTFKGGTKTSDLNESVIPILMKAGIKILEIKKGSDLENEYLKIL